MCFVHVIKMIDNLIFSQKCAKISYENTNTKTMKYNNNKFNNNKYNNNNNTQII